MKTNTVLKRAIDQKANGLEVDVAQTVAASWLKVNAVEEALVRLDTGIVQWQGSPPVQNAMAAMLTDMLVPTDKVMALGFQPYMWMRATGVELSEILTTQLGKSLPEKTIAATAEDIAASMAHGKVTVVSLHVESTAGWNDVRTISAAAVKAETPMLLLISAGAPAPKGVTIETIDNWADAAVEIRNAMEQVRDQKAIRVVSVADMTAASIENAMLEASRINAEDWQAQVRKNADGAEIAVNAAYRAPVKSY